MVIAFLFDSSWLPDQQIHRSELEGDPQMPRRITNQSQRRAKGDVRGCLTLGGLQLLHVPLPCHPRLLAVASPHGPSAPELLPSPSGLPAPALSVQRATGEGARKPAGA